MADDNDKDRQEPDKRKKIRWLALFLCLLLAGVCIFYIWHKHTAPQEAQDVPSAVAVANVDKLITAHPDYVRLQKLEAEKMLIFSQLKSYAIDARSLKAAQQITPAADVFNQLIEQQDNLRDIKTRQQLKEETAAKENELRQAVSAERQAAIEEINSKFYNEILNCTIKLDNAKNLRLTKDEQDVLYDRLDELKKERGKAVFELEQQFNLRIAKDLMQWRMQRENELGLANAVEHQSDSADSAQRQMAERQREAQYAQDRLQMMNARRKDSVRLLVLLHTKENEIKLLKKSILRDISKMATKIAVQKHLKLVVANGRLNRDSFGASSTLPFENTMFGGMVVGVDAEDITEDILAEMKAKAQEAELNKAANAVQAQEDTADEKFEQTGKME